jgi:molybdopterin molybdotransferase
MISVAEAQELILSHSKKGAREWLEISELRDEVLRMPLIADRCHPPFDRVAMDGVAIKKSAWDLGTRQFMVTGCQRAGEPQKELQDPESCLLVMTGAPLPKGADCVIRYEDCLLENDRAQIDSGLKFSHYQNVHRRAIDYAKGETLVREFALLGSPHWSVAATLGTSRVEISRRPRIAVVSTGDELVNVHETPHDHQIRSSNAFGILSSLKAYGFTRVTIDLVQDDEAKLARHFQKRLDDHDFLIVSGGVSHGKFDYVPKVLADLKIKKVFHEVRQKPGKPLWFGVSSAGKQVFGLPGNPVATMVCLHRFVLPALWRYLGLESMAQNRLYGVLTEDVEYKKELTYFLPVKAHVSQEGVVSSRPIYGNGSGDFSALLGSSGFVELPSDQTRFRKGYAFPLYLWRGLI